MLALLPHFRDNYRPTDAPRKLLRSTTRFGGPHACRNAPTSSDLFAGEENGVRRTQFGRAAEANHALPLEFQALVAHERFLSVDGLHESAVRALIDQYETVATDLDARVQARETR